MPIDRGTLDQQLRALGEGERWWDHREMRHLPSVLRSDERVLAIASGKVARVRWLHRSWLFVVTDARLICMRAQRKSWRQMEVAGEHITRITVRVGPFRGRVRVWSVDGRYKMLVPRADAYHIASALNSIAVNLQNLPAGGATRMIRRVVDHVMALPVAVTQPVPTPAPVMQLKAPEPDREREHELEQQIDDLQEQVRFLEQLLHERQAGIQNR